jgi:phage terminase small subunit
MNKGGRPTRVSKVLTQKTIPKTVAGAVNDKLATPVAKFEDQNKPLSPKEWKFVQEFVAGCGEVTLKEAAIRAGYTEVRASQSGNDLTNPKKNPHIVAAIQEYRSQLAQRYGTTYERHMRDMQTIRDAALAAGAYGAAVQAEYRRGQALGTIYVDRKEIRHGTIDSMSREEVERKLAELKALYGGPPPKEIIDLPMTEIGKSLEVDPPFDPTQTLKDLSEARAIVVQPDQREPAFESDDPD